MRPVVDDSLDHLLRREFDETESSAALCRRVNFDEAFQDIRPHPSFGLIALEEILEQLLLVRALAQSSAEDLPRAVEPLLSDRHVIRAELGFEGGRVLNVSRRQSRVHARSERLRRRNDTCSGRLRGNWN